MPAALSIPMNSKTYNWGYRERARAASRTAAALPARAARSSAARPRSTASSMCAAIRSISSAGRRRARRAGDIANVLPYFRRAESFGGGADAYRGGDGPLATAPRPQAQPALRRLHRGGPAGRLSASAPTSTASGRRVSARLDMTVKDGVRWSAANAYLRPAMKRPNLTVVTHALATRIAFEGRRAAGVHYRRGGRDTRRARRREVILCGGRDQFAAIAEAFRRRPGGGTAARSASTSSPTARASARTCRTISNSIFQVASKQPITLYCHTGLFGAGADRGRNGCCAGTGSARPIISRPAASSARAPASAIPTSSTISCRWRSPTTARRSPTSTAFRPMSGRCARRAAAGCA